MDSPPSTKITVPLMNFTVGWLSATIVAATSSVTVRRRCGLRRMVVSIMISLPGILRSAGVSVTPALMQFTRMPRGPNSRASWRVCDSRAALAADTAP